MEVGPGPEPCLGQVATVEGGSHESGIPADTQEYGPGEAPRPEACPPTLVPAHSPEINVSAPFLLESRVPSQGRSGGPEQRNDQEGLSKTSRTPVPARATEPRPHGSLGPLSHSTVAPRRWLRTEMAPSPLPTRKPLAQ